VPDPISVRAVQSGDHAAWSKLWEAYNVFYGRVGAQALPPEVSAMTWSRFFDAYEPVHALVAERGGDLLGLAHYLFHRSTIHLAPVCYLEDLFTAQGARGQGIARALIEAVYERALAAGVHAVYWQTHESNAPARRLYDQVAANLGFIVYDKAL